jgi:hypothetical protein
MKNDHSFSTKLELLEILYIISVIDFYLDHPLDNNAPKRKRGIDYAYSLVSNLSTGMTREFREKLLEKAKYEGSMDDLFIELEMGYKVPNQIPMSDINNNGKEEIKQEVKKMKKCEPFAEHIDPTHIPQNNLYPANAFIEQKMITIPNDLRIDTPLFDHPEISPYPMFSPTSLSAGPAAAAARASKAACFMSPYSFAQNFSDFTNATMRYKENLQPELSGFSLKPSHINIKKHQIYRCKQPFTKNSHQLYFN